MKAITRYLRNSSILLCVVLLGSRGWGVQYRAQNDYSKAALKEFGGAIFRDNGEGRLMPIPLQNTEVNIDFAPGVSQVSVDQYFTNEGGFAAEAQYLFPLPSDATILVMDIYIEDRVISSVVKEKEQATVEYTEAKEAGKTASLLVRLRPNLFSMSLANLMPGIPVRVHLEYIQPVDYKNGRYRIEYPMVAGERYFPSSVRNDAEAMAGPQMEESSSGYRLSLNVMVHGIRAKTFIPLTHDMELEDDLGGGNYKLHLIDGTVIPNRNFAMILEVDDSEVYQLDTIQTETEEGLYRMVSFIPFDDESRALAPSVEAKDIVFIVDRSGSMGGSRMAQAKGAVKKCIQMLRVGDRFNVIAYDNQVETLTGGLADVSVENGEKAEAFIEAITSRGGTVMQPALELAIEALKDSNRRKIIVLITDGDLGNEASLLSLLERTADQIKIFPIGIGSAPNEYLMTELAKAGNGEALYIHDEIAVEEEIVELYSTLERPALSQIELQWMDTFGGSIEIESYPEIISDVYFGRPLYIWAKMPRGFEGTFKLSGIENGEPVVYEIEMGAGGFDFAGAKQLFGKAKLNALERDTHYFRGEAELSELKAHILETALEFQLMSAYTARVAVEERIVRDPKDPSVSVRVPNYRAKDQGGELGAGMESDDEVIQLNDLVVSVDDGRSYFANNSSSATSFNVALRDLPVPSSVVTKQFIEDQVQDKTNEPGRTPNSALAFTFLNTLNDMVKSDAFTDGMPSDYGAESKDVERLEIVEGMGGHLYAETNSWGLVNAIRRRAIGEWEHEIKVSYGDKGYWYGELNSAGIIGSDLNYIAALSSESYGTVDEVKESLSGGLDWNFIPRKGTARAGADYIDVYGLGTIKQVETGVRWEATEELSFRYENRFQKVDLKELQSVLSNYVWNYLPNDLNEYLYAKQDFAESERQVHHFGTTWNGSLNEEWEGLFSLDLQDDFRRFKDSFGGVVIKREVENRNYALTTKVEYNDRLSILGTILYSDFEDKTENGSNESVDYSLGTSLRIIDALSLYINYGQSTLNDLRGRASNVATYERFSVDQVETYQMGTKIEFWDNRLSGNLTYSHIEGDHLIIKNGLTTSGLNYVDLGDYGVDLFYLDFRFMPVFKYQLLVEYVNILSFEKLEDYPKGRLEIWNVYAFDEGIFKHLRVGLGLQYQTGYRSSTNKEYDPYLVTNLMLSYDLELVRDYRMTLQLNVNNIGDEDYQINEFSEGLSREYRFTASFQF